MASVDKPSLFDEQVYQSIVARFDKIQADTKAQWGKMNAAQMFAHCTEIQEVCNNKALEKTPFFIKLLSGFIKKSVLNDKPYPKSLQTHKQYIMNDSKVFEEEKARFFKSLEKFVQNTGSAQHTLFGEISAAERSWAIYKHHTHHLEQFGV